MKNQLSIPFEEESDISKKVIKSGKMAVKNGKEMENRVLEGVEEDIKGSSLKLLKQNDFNRWIKNKGVNPREHQSKIKIPDFSVIDEENNTAHIFEIKSQKTDGSSDEKLRTAHHSKNYYDNIFSFLNHEVKFYFILSEWFKHPKYKSDLEYINFVGCDYIFEGNLDIMGVIKKKKKMMSIKLIIKTTMMYLFNPFYVLYEFIKMFLKNN